MRSNTSPGAYFLFYFVFSIETVICLSCFIESSLALADAAYIPIWAVIVDTTDPTEPVVPIVPFADSSTLAHAYRSSSMYSCSSPLDTESLRPSQRKPMVPKYNCWGDECDKTNFAMRHRMNVLSVDADTVDENLQTVVVISYDYHTAVSFWDSTKHSPHSQSP